RRRGVFQNHCGGAVLWTVFCINTGMLDTRDLQDEQWKILDPLIPEPAKRSDVPRSSLEAAAGSSERYLMGVTHGGPPGLNSRIDIRPTRPVIADSSDGSSLV